MDLQFRPEFNLSLTHQIHVGDALAGLEKERHLIKAHDLYTSQDLGHLRLCAACEERVREEECSSVQRGTLQGKGWRGPSHSAIGSGKRGGLSLSAIAERGGKGGLSHTSIAERVRKRVVL